MRGLTASSSAFSTRQGGKPNKVIARELNIEEFHREGTRPSDHEEAQRGKSNTGGIGRAADGVRGGVEMVHYSDTRNRCIRGG